MRQALTTFALLVLTVSLAAAQPAGIRGEAAAVAAAERLLESVGGRQAWRARSLTVEERGFLATGEVAQLHISRDLQRGARRIERVTPTAKYVEWVAPERGWSMNNGVVTAMPATELAIELQGVKQEPYAIYYRLAHQDPALRVELREQNSLLLIYDRDERVLCWFQLDPLGGIVGWGNFYDGRINQHYYGPLADMGDANLPKWGAASNGGFRFEYVSARLTDQPVTEPARTPPPTGR